MMMTMMMTAEVTAAATMTAVAMVAMASMAAIRTRLTAYNTLFKGTLGCMHGLFCRGGCFGHPFWFILVLCFID